LSIVVLPFANLSGEPSQDYFAERVTENLTTELPRIHHRSQYGLHPFTYKGKSVDARRRSRSSG
jgi:TolB-like protein